MELQVLESPESASALVDVVGRAQTGEQAAKMEVLRRFDPLVRKVAGRYAHVSYDDALQEGALALLTCLEDFDVTLGVPFAAFAQARVRGRVRTAMRRMWVYDDRTVHPGAGEDGEDAAWEAVVAAHTRAGGTGSRGQGQSGYQTIEMRMLVHQAGLSRREWNWMEGWLQGLSVSEIARNFGVSTETVKTWRKRALSKLRAVWFEE